MKDNAKDNGERYCIEEGSQSKHCCFEWTVIDTHHPQNLAICECFELEDAKRICEALNLTEGKNGSIG